MTERYGGDMIYSILSNETAVTDIVGSSIYEDLKVPAEDTSNETINFYKTGPYLGGIEYFESRFSADCRAGNYNTSQEIAYQVKEALNRKFSTVNSKDYFAICDILTTIPPINDTDVYNTPVSIYVRRRQYA